MHLQILVSGFYTFFFATGGFLAFLPLVSCQTTFIASNLGRDEANKLWRSGRYKCSRRDLDRFERRVRDDVYRTCDDSFRFNRDWARACKDGAKGYVDEKRKKCSNTAGGDGASESKDLGNALVSLFNFSLELLCLSPSFSILLNNSHIL